MDSTEVRKIFLDYFEKNGHRIVPGYSLIPPEDPSLLFVNAGMVQFKDFFTGLRKPSIKRAATSQKCLRVSGKHNDLEQVGRTPRHHTFFEMLGNFSFGDYFKKDAIIFAWELLTSKYGLNADDLYVTVHPDDSEAKDLWKKEIGISGSRIFEDMTNFWAMGETGPCGHCSEIHIDRGRNFKGKSLEEPGERFMELWNLVFMQFERDSEGAIKPLPAPSIDTGMGLERITSVLQVVRSNFETDLFMPLIREMEKISGRKFLSGNAEDDIGFRVIADHARAASFLITEGVLPENDGRGYVLRRLMRRAIRFGRKLGVTEPFFHEICTKVISSMGSVFPELAENKHVIEKAVKNEEERFLHTIDAGLSILKAEMERMTGSRIIEGKVAFNLYDTHGFPLDLTQLIASENGFTVDEPGFSLEMDIQRERGKASWKENADILSNTGRIAGEKNITTDFSGYENESCTARILLVLKNDQAVEQILEGEQGIILTDVTPFYGEAGGQAGDTGRIFRENDYEFKVNDTKKINDNLFVHYGMAEKGKFRVSDIVRMQVDTERRSMIRRNHSATHLLHHALRTVLGTHVKQRGSLVNESYLRFDFSHFKPLSSTGIQSIEQMVNSKISENSEVSTAITGMDDAVKSGAIAFFGDKYGEKVRMVSMGRKDTGVSIELCGGTHVKFTGDIGIFKILQETSVSAGVRRIVAKTHIEALKEIQKKDNLVSEICRLFNVNENELIPRIMKFLHDERDLRQEMDDLKIKAGAVSGQDKIETVGKIKVLVHHSHDLDARSSRSLIDRLRDQVKTGIVMLFNENEGKLAVLLGVTDDMRNKFRADALLKEILMKNSGRGGGNDRLAQGSADISSINAIKKDFYDIIIRLSNE
jgi:alanyl-tRNA synthetase